MKKAVRGVIALLVVLCLCSVPVYATSVTQQDTEEGVFQVRSIDSFTQEEIESDEALQEILERVAQLGRMRSSGQASWTGDVYVNTYTDTSGATVFAYAVPYIEFHYGDVGTYGTCTWYSTLEAVKTVSVNGVSTDDPSFYNSFTFKNIKCRMAGGSNTRLRNITPTIQSSQATSNGINAIIGLGALIAGPDLSDAVSVVSYLAQLIDFSKDNVSVGTRTAYGAVGAEFSKNIVEEGDYAKLEVDAITANSVINQNERAYCVVEWSFDVYCGISAKGSVGFSDAQITKMYLSNGT